MQENDLRLCRLMSERLRLPVKVLLVEAAPPADFWRHSLLSLMMSATERLSLSAHQAAKPPIGLDYRLLFPGEHRRRVGEIVKAQINFGEHLGDHDYLPGVH